MEKRGSKPKGKVKIKWSPEFAYAIGLLVTDGCLSKDGRHIDLTSKDREQLKNFLKCLNSRNKISLKHSGLGKEYLRVQLGDVLFYKFLLDIGLTPRKTKTISVVDVPDIYFFDFLRGHFDGDGTFYSYWDHRWRSSFMFYTVFISASDAHIGWIRNKLKQSLGIKGHITRDGRKSTLQLKYAKNDSLKLLPKMYYSEDIICLRRKRLKIQRALGIIGKTLNKRGW